MSSRQTEGEPCPKCGGRGWIVESAEIAANALPCECRILDLKPRLLGASGIPPRYQNCTLASFVIEIPDAKHQLLEAKSICTRYVEHFLTEEGRFREVGLLFEGPPGVGKTHLAVAVLRNLIERYRVRGLFVDFTSLIHRIQSTFDASSSASKHNVLDPVMEAQVLVLDELGAQKPSAWVSDVLYLIMNTRYTRRLPTLVTTNYRLHKERETKLDRDDRDRSTPSELLSHRIPALLVSRLYEMTQCIAIDSVDFRQEYKAHHRI